MKDGGVGRSEELLNQSTSIFIIIILLIEHICSLPDNFSSLDVQTVFRIEV